MLKIAVCIHLYYTEQFNEIRRYLASFGNINYDLYFTLPYENKNYIDVIKKYYRSSKIILCDNCGFDIYPFLVFLNDIDLSQYDIIFKLHTKRDINFKAELNGIDISGERWRKYMYEALLKDHNRVRFITRMFSRQPHIGMIAAKEIVLRGDDAKINIDINCVEKVMNECNMNICNLEFAAGAIFVVRAELLKSLKERAYKKEDFPPYYPRDWNSLPYCIERLFGCMVSAQGYALIGI